LEFGLLLDFSLEKIKLFRLQRALVF